MPELRGRPGIDVLAPKAPGTPRLEAGQLPPLGQPVDRLLGQLEERRDIGDGRVVSHRGPTLSSGWGPGRMASLAKDVQP